MSAKIAFLAAMVGLIAAAPQYNYEPPQAPSSLYETPLDAAPQNIVPAVVSPPMQGMPYDFTWGVEDGDSGNAFSHVENSDGQTTQGEYRVLLPTDELRWSNSTTTATASTLRSPTRSEAPRLNVQSHPPFCHESFMYLFSCYVSIHLLSWEVSLPE
nr:uncharacterized protein LOC113820431 [Penaeus vannamei]